MTKNQCESHSAVTSIGIDIGKDVFHIVAFDMDGKMVLRRKFKRLALENEFKKLPPGIAAHRDHQPDPRLSDRTGDRRSNGCACVA